MCEYKKTKLFPGSTQGTVTLKDWKQAMTSRKQNIEVYSECDNRIMKHMSTSRCSAAGTYSMKNIDEPIMKRKISYQRILVIIFHM